MNDFLKPFFDLIEQKFQKNTIRSISQNPLDSAEYLKSHKYFEAIIEEISEAKDEVKPYNSIYLETELGDIFWTYLNLLYCLESEGYISKEAVFTRCQKKFHERVEGIEQEILWNDIKKMQKQELLQEHTRRYGNKIRK